MQACMCVQTHAHASTLWHTTKGIMEHQSKAKQNKAKKILAWPRLWCPGTITAEAAVACAAAEAKFSNSQKFGLWHDTAECGFETHPLRKTH